MTAPARVAGPASRTRTRTQPPPRERDTGKPPAAQPDRIPGGRGRSAAAERAYARRAQRSQRPAESGPQVERKQGSASRVTFVVAVMVLLVGGVVATLWFATQATADAYRLEQAKNTTNQLQVQVGQLQQEVAQQDSPPSLAARAQQLGMVPAGDPAHLVVGTNGKVTVIGTPSAAQQPPPPVTSTPPTSTPPSGTNAAKPPAKSGTSTPPSTPPSTTTPPTGG
ncbi:MAG TPA: hypothetical protein VFX16_34915 [Pseudonocardiaceae bacterium]|nr:hypothetical protein [Pseudonocardiaceae bacterium]